MEIVVVEFSSFGYTTRAGFTGTEYGMSKAQALVVGQALAVVEPTEFHHGDCIGADAQAHLLAWTLGIAIKVHPPSDPKKRAWLGPSPGDAAPVTVLEPFPYLVRNGHIVEASDLLIAAPREMHEIQRSGTWATVRKAETAGVPVFVVYRDGSAEMRPPPRMMAPLN